MDPLDSLRRVPDLVPRDDAALARARARLAGRIDGSSGRRAPSRRTVLIGAAAAVAGAAVTGSVLALPRRASAAGLAQAADQVTDPRLLPGQFLRVTTLQDELAPDAPVLRTVQVVWIPEDRHDVWVQRTTAPDGAVHVDRAAFGQVPAVIDYEAVEFVMRTRTGFDSLVPRWEDMRDPVNSCFGVMWALPLLSSGEVPALQRAWLYRYLDALPGVHERGTATLSSGRTGTVFAADDHWRVARWELVVDLATGEYLGDRYWDMSSSAGFLTEARALSTDIVGSAP